MYELVKKKYCIVFLLDATSEFDQAYTYQCPESFQLYIGQLVEVPFGRGNSPRRAVIVDQTDECHFSQIKTISRALVKEPIYLIDQIELAKEIKRRYFCTMGQAFKTISPPNILKVGKKTSRACRLVNKEESFELLRSDSFSSIQQQRVVEMLLDVEEALVAELIQGCQVSESVLKGLQKKNVIEFFKQEVERDFESFPVWQEEQVKDLNQEQKIAIDQVLSTVSGFEGILNENLLFGVTGSGKTEVYLRLASEIIEQGKSVIILVPEISLTPLMISRFINKFGDDVAIWHSRLTLTQRFEQWQKIIKQDKKIVVGARSAIFAPFKNIGLIIIDEEQESSYISETVPRYKANEIARIRAIQHKAILLLGSATPSVESYHRVEIGKSRLLTLSKRAKPAPLPRIKLIQMKNEHARANFDGVFSLDLLDNLKKTFAEKGQAILFLNRRGLTSAIQCADCGNVIYCPHCEIPLTRHVNQYQNNRYRLTCHYCGHIEKSIEHCPDCGSDRLINTGIGTQKVEECFNIHFPDVHAVRMDFDTMLGQDAHRKTLSDFREGKYQCLIGTQMIAKGHDFSNVKTVGILAVDSLLHTSNYKSEERAFQLITQAAGRSGRSDEQGDVFIQGYDLQNYVIENAAIQDYPSFYREEMEFRKRAGFPPFLELGLIVQQSYQYSLLENEINSLYHFLKSSIVQNQQYFKGTTIYSPVALPKLRNKYRSRIIVKSDSKLKLATLFQQINHLKQNHDIGIYMDINPEHVL